MIVRVPTKGSALGRNGYMQVHALEMWHQSASYWPATEQGLRGLVHIEIVNSRGPGNWALNFNIDDAEAVAEAILKVAEEWREQQ